MPKSRVHCKRKPQRFHILRILKGILQTLAAPRQTCTGLNAKRNWNKVPAATSGACFQHPAKILPLIIPNNCSWFKKLNALPGIKRVFISSGIRYDLLLHDKKNGAAYLEKIVKDNVSGQMKIRPGTYHAPCVNLNGQSRILTLLLKFKQQFDALSKRSEKKQFLTYYLIAAHPGCRMKDMQALKEFTTQKLKITPEQSPDFHPHPFQPIRHWCITPAWILFPWPLCLWKNIQRKNKNKKNIVTAKPHWKK